MKADDPLNIKVKFCENCQRYIDPEEDGLHFLDDFETCRLLEETEESIAQHEIDQTKGD